MLKWDNGDYVSNGAGGLKTVSGAEALLTRALMRLTAHRGAFPFLPEFGSRLWQLGAVGPAGRESAAEQYVTDALSPEEGLSVTGVSLTEGEAGAAAGMTVTLVYDGTNYALSVTVA